MAELHDEYGRVAKAYGRKEDGGGVGSRPRTAILMMLFSQNQPYIDARQIPADVILELVEAKLDESLSYLDGEGPRLARMQIRINRQFGSVRNFVAEALKEKRHAP